MFSEKDIINQCRICNTRCDDVAKCPLKVEWSNAPENKIIPPVPFNWEFTQADLEAPKRTGDKYSTEELIAGLSKLINNL